MGERMHEEMIVCAMLVEKLSVSMEVYFLKSDLKSGVNILFSVYGN